MSKILILDFGSQTTHLIKCRFLDLGIETEIIEPLRELYKDEVRICGR